MAHNNFTQEEIAAAKAARDEIINGDSPELKSIYMAGEIVMWDELQSPSDEKEVEKLKAHLEGMYANNKEGWDKSQAFEKEVERLKETVANRDKTIEKLILTLEQNNIPQPL